MSAAGLKRRKWGWGVQSIYKGTYFNKCVIYADKYEFVYPIGIKQGNHITLAI